MDVLSPELIKELEKLQDRVPPFSTDKAIKIVEEQLGGTLASHFEEFERQPIAAASLAQVPPCRLSQGVHHSCARPRPRRVGGVFALGGVT